jgi:hypothetical protein
MSTHKRARHPDLDVEAERGARHRAMKVPERLGHLIAGFSSSGRRLRADTQV